MIQVNTLDSMVEYTPQHMPLYSEPLMITIFQQGVRLLGQTRREIQGEKITFWRDGNDWFIQADTANGFEITYRVNGSAEVLNRKLAIILMESLRIGKSGRFILQRTEKEGFFKIIKQHVPWTKPQQI